MTYMEALDGQIVTRREVELELKRHSLPMAEFVADFGDHDTYESDLVLGWMGY